MSRTKQLLEKQITQEELDDYGEQRYQDELNAQPTEEDVLPRETSIWKAIADFQADVPNLVQNSSTNKYTYVDLAEIVRVITPILRKHNLAYIQPLDNKGIKTILFHTLTGEKIESNIEIPIYELDYMNIYQSIGSAISYYRRYSISSLLNLISEKDTDASGSQKKVQSAPVQVKKSINENELEQAIKMIDEGNYSLDKLQKNYFLTPQQLSKLRTYYDTKD